MALPGVTGVLFLGRGNGVQGAADMNLMTAQLFHAGEGQRWAWHTNMFLLANLWTPGLSMVAFIVYSPKPVCVTEQRIEDGKRARRSSKRQVTASFHHEQGACLTVAWQGPRPVRTRASQLKRCDNTTECQRASAPNIFNTSGAMTEGSYVSRSPAREAERRNFGIGMYAYYMYAH